jgi:hypothetical protein
LWFLRRTVASVVIGGAGDGDERGGLQPQTILLLLVALQLLVVVVVIIISIRSFWHEVAGVDRAVSSSFIALLVGPSSSFVVHVATHVYVFLPRRSSLIDLRAISDLVGWHIDVEVAGRGGGSGGIAKWQ